MQLLKQEKFDDTLVFIDQKYKLSKFIMNSHVASLKKDELFCVLDKIKELHDQKIESKVSFNFEKKLTFFENLIFEIAPNYFDKYKKYFLNKNKIIADYNKYVKKNENFLCHNDLTAINILVTDNNNIFLIDWEYASRNDIMFDIASFINENNLDNDEIVCQHYFQRPLTENEKFRLITCKNMQNLL